MLIWWRRGRGLLPSSGCNSWHIWHDDHFVVLTATDEFGQRFRIPLFFRLEGRIRLSARSCYYYSSFSASPPSSVTGLAVVGVTSSSIEVSWCPPLSDGGKVDITLASLCPTTWLWLPPLTGSSVTSYRIQLVESRSVVTKVDLGPDARRHLLTGFRPQTTYASVMSCWILKIIVKLFFSSAFVSAENSARQGPPLAILAITTAVIS